LPLTRDETSLLTRQIRSRGQFRRVVTQAAYRWAFRRYQERAARTERRDLLRARRTTPR
jgi:hypothetical protein